MEIRCEDIIRCHGGVCRICQPIGRQEAQKLFIEGDIVRGNTPAGITGPVCVLANQFKRKENVVFRIRVRNVAGEPLDDKTIITVPQGSYHLVSSREALDGPSRGGVLDVLT